MTRPMSAAMEAALQADIIRYCFLVEIGFVSATVYLTSLDRDISYGGHTYLGNGWLRPINRVTESADVRANGFSIGLGGLSSGVMSLVLTDTSQSKEAVVNLGLLNSSDALIADPFPLARAYFDTTEIRDSGDYASVVMNFETDLIRRSRANEFRYTYECQLALFPGDTGFRYAGTIEDWTGFWGKQARPKFLRKRKVNKK